MPKSTSLALPPLSVTRTFWGLMSRWTTPCAWAWASASAESAPMLGDVAVGEHPVAAQPS